MEPPARTPLAWAVWGIITVTDALGPVMTDMYLPNVLAIMRDLDCSFAEVSRTLQIGWIVAALATLGTGAISDALGRRGPLIAALGIFVSGSVICACAPTVTWLVVGRALQCTGQGAQVFARTIARDMLDSVAERSRVNATIGVARSVLVVLAPLIGSAVGSTLGWRAVFVLLGAVVAAVLPLALIALPETAPAHGLLSAAQRASRSDSRSVSDAAMPPPAGSLAAGETAAPGAAGASASASSMTSSASAQGEGEEARGARRPARCADVRVLFGSRLYVGLSVFVSLTMGTVAVQITLMPAVLMSHYGLSSVHAGMVLTVLPLAGIGGSAAALALSRRVRAFDVLQLGTVPYALTAALAALAAARRAPVGWWAVPLPSVVLHTMRFVWDPPAKALYLSEWEHVAGTAEGVAMTMMCITMAGASAAATAAYDGTPSGYFGAVALSASVGVSWFWLVLGLSPPAAARATAPAARGSLLRQPQQARRAQHA